MIKCKAVLQIHSGLSSLSSNDIWLYKHFELPQFPVIGMTILVDGMELDLSPKKSRQESGFCQMAYDVGNELLELYFEDSQIYRWCAQIQKIAPRPCIEEIKKEYLEEGWCLK
jgi:hypothetical protein